jgi:hypothetical protein
MADFCAQCTYEVFNIGHNDLSGITSEEETSEGTFALVLCEGCGETLVDHAGRCVAYDCLKKHGKEPDHA